MFESFSRSWQLTKQTFKIINKDKRLMLFPIFSAIFSVIFVLALIIPTFLINIPEMNAAAILIIFLLYFGLAFISTFFNVGLVYIVKNIIEKKEVTFKSSISFAFSRLGSIFLWSIISATVGLILRIIDNIANNQKGAARIILKGISSLLGAAWSFITIFVIPIMVYKNKNPFNAISESTIKIKKTWGENLIRNIGFGILQFILMLIGIIITILGIILLSSIKPLLIIFVIIMAIYFVLVTIYFNIANTIFNTALYVYSETGKMPFEYSNETVKEVFSKEQN